MQDGDFDVSLPIVEISVLHWNVLQLCLVRELCDLGQSSFFLSFLIKSSVIVIFILLLVSLIPVLCVLQHAALSEYRPIMANRSQTNSMADVKLTLIPIIFIVLRIWSTVRFILLLADSPVRQNPVLVTLHVSLIWILLFVYQRLICTCVCVLFYAQRTNMCVFNLVHVTPSM